MLYLHLTGLVIGGRLAVGSSTSGAAGSTDGQPAISGAGCPARRCVASGAISTVGGHHRGKPGSPHSGPAW